MIEQVFRAAVWVAASLLGVGLILWLAGAGGEFVMHAGLWLLITVPIARVVTALIGWTRDRDWVFAALTIVVLLSLLAPLATSVLAGR